MRSPVFLPGESHGQRNPEGLRHKEFDVTEATKQSTQHILKVFIEFVTISFLFYDLEACGILTPRPGIEPAPPA